MGILSERDLGFVAEIWVGNVCGGEKRWIGLKRRLPESEEKEKHGGF